LLKSKIRRVSAITNLHIYFQGNICKILLLVRLENMFSQTALGDQSKISLTDPFEIPWRMKIILIAKFVHWANAQEPFGRKHTVKRTIIVRQYYNQQVKFSALRPEYVHGILISSL
jgi:hypothetical protein